MTRALQQSLLLNSLVITAHHESQQHFVVPHPDYDDFYDPNLDSDVISLGTYARSTQYLLADRFNIDDDSPYPEVRSAVANTDDPDMPVGTLRAWTIGLLWSIILPGLNQFFFFRYPSITVTGVRTQLPTDLSVVISREHRF